MDYLDKIRAIKESRPANSLEQLSEIADEMEEILGEAEMWRIVRIGFSVDELAENLEFIAREADI